LIALLDGVNGINREHFYTQLPFAIRGTKDWDRREKMRKKMGCYCVCLGPIPVHCADGEKWQHKNKMEVRNDRLIRTKK